MKMFLITTMMFMFSFSSAVFADESKSKDECPAGTSCSENYMITHQKEYRKIKKVRMMKFSEILQPVPNGALYTLQKKAQAWLEQQDPETILGYSETVVCPRQGSCDAYITILHTKMVSEEVIKK